MVAASQVSLGILAGGRASRLGGIDKALQPFAGTTLLARALDAFPETFAERLLSYNREPGDYLSGSGLRIVPDLRVGALGPLAALEALFHSCRTPWLVSVPVDIRDWPPALASGLIESVGQGQAGVALKDADGLQPLVGLWNVPALAASVSAALDAGERAVHRWLAAHQIPVHDISPWRLGNLNSRADFFPR